jgi:acidic type I keratin
MPMLLPVLGSQSAAAMSQEVASSTPVQSGQSNIHELKRTFQALEIDLQTQRNKVSYS